MSKLARRPGHGVFAVVHVERQPTIKAAGFHSFIRRSSSGQSGTPWRTLAAGERFSQPGGAAADRYAKVFGAVVEAEVSGCAQGVQRVTRLARQRGEIDTKCFTAAPQRASTGVSNRIWLSAGPDSQAFSPISCSSCPAAQPA